MYASNLLMVTLVKFCSPLDFAVQSDSHHCMELILNASPTRSTQPYAQSADFQAWSSASTGCTEASPSEWSIAMTNHSGELPLPTEPPQSGSSLASTSCFPPSMHHNIGALYSPSGHALSSPNMLGRASGSGLPVTQQIR